MNWAGKRNWCPGVRGRIPILLQRELSALYPGEPEAHEKGKQGGAEQLAGQIRNLVCSTYGHTLVLFTSYTLMGSVQQLLRDRSRFRWCRYGEIPRKRLHGLRRWRMRCCSQPAPAGRAWIFRETWSRPDHRKTAVFCSGPIHEAQREQYRSLESYIQTIVVPDMQKKLRQGFGRAIRTEQDTCVVSIWITGHRRRQVPEMFWTPFRSARW